MLLALIQSSLKNQFILPEFQILASTLSHQADQPNFLYKNSY